MAIRELLDPAKRMAALHRYCVEVDPVTAKAEGWSDFKEFAQVHDDLTASLLRAGPGRSKRYLVTWHNSIDWDDWGKGKRGSAESGNGALAPRDILRYLIFEEDGTSRDRQEKYVFGGNIADLNGDGEPEIFKSHVSASDPGIPGLPPDSPQNAIPLYLGDLVITPPGDDAKPAFALLYNAHPRDASPTDVWGYEICDRDQDGFYEIALGPVIAPSGVQRMIEFRWDQATKHWKGPPAKRDDHYRILDPDKWEDEIREIAGLGGLGYPIKQIDRGDGEAERLSGWSTEMGAEEISKPYEPTHLAALSNDDLLRYFECAPVAGEYRQEKFRAATSVRDFWSLPPKEAAMQYILRNRPPSSWAEFAIGPLPNLREVPPETGDLTFTSGPSGCFAPHGSWVRHLHLAGNDSYLLHAGAIEFWRGAPTAAERMHVEFRKVSLSPEVARHLMQTIWWMSRMRSRQLVENVSGQYWSGGGTGERDGIVEFSESDSIRATNHAGWPTEFLGGDQPRGTYSAASFISLVAQLFEREVPEQLGAQWQSQALEAGATLSEKELQATKQKVAETLQLFIDGKAGVRVAAIAAVAAGERSWTELEPLVRKAADRLPDPRELEKHIARVDGYIEFWRRKLGPQAGVAGHRDRDQRRFAREFLFKEPAGGTMSQFETRIGLSAVLTPPAVIAVIARLRAEEIDDRRFAIVDALHNARGSVEYQAPDGDRAIALARKTFAAELRKLELANDPEGLLAWGREEPEIQNFAIARLAKIDRAKALELARHCEEKADHEMVLSSLREAREQLEAESGTTSTGVALDVPKALALLADARGRVIDREEALDFLVPAKDARRHPDSKIDDLLRQLLSRQGMEDQGRPDTLPIGAARRLAGKAWQALLEYPAKNSIIGFERHSKVLPALTLIAEQEQEPYRAKMQERLGSELKASLGWLNSWLWAAWILDLRELDSELKRLATRGPQDFDSELGFGGTNQRVPVAQRLHRARHLIALWNEEEPLTLARSLVAFAVANAEMFEEFEGTSHRRLAAEIARAKPDLKEPELVAAREFIEWAVTNAAGTLRRPAKPDQIKAVAAFLRENFAK